MKIKLLLSFSLFFLILGYEAMAQVEVRGVIKDYDTGDPLIGATVVIKGTTIGAFSDIFPELRFFNDFPAGPRKDYTFLLDIPRRTVVGGVITAQNPATTPWQQSDRQHPMYRKYLISEDLTFMDRPQTFRSIQLYRYAEILLIYAEAKAMSSPDASAIEALNQVKRRAAGLPYQTTDASVDVSSATPNEIVDEKGWELAAENKRWFDLVRTERVAEMAAKRDPSEPVTLVRQPTSAQYIAPIPFSTISLSNLVQNPEGFKIQ